MGIRLRMEEKDSKTLTVVFTIILEKLNDRDSGDPHADMEAPKIPPKAEQK